MIVRHNNSKIEVFFHFGQKRTVASGANLLNQSSPKQYGQTYTFIRDDKSEKQARQIHWYPTYLDTCFDIDISLN